MKLKCQEEAIVEAEAEEDQIYQEAEEGEIIRDLLQEEGAIENSLPEKILEADLLLKEVVIDRQDLIFKILMIIKFMLPDFLEKLLSTI